MATQAIAVLRALWDFQPESLTEVALVEGQTLFLIEREDGSPWWMVKVNHGEQDEVGLVPASYVQQVEPKATVYVQQDFVGSSVTVLTVKRGEQLRLYEVLDDWSLVQRVTQRGSIGYVPSHIVGESAPVDDPVSSMVGAWPDDAIAKPDPAPIPGPSSHPQGSTAADSDESLKDWFWSYWTSLAAPESGNAPPLAHTPPVPPGGNDTPASDDRPPSPGVRTDVPSPLDDTFNPWTTFHASPPGTPRARPLPYSAEPRSWHTSTAEPLDDAPRIPPYAFESPPAASSSRFSDSSSEPDADIQEAIARSLSPISTTNGTKGKGKQRDDSVSASPTSPRPTHRLSRIFHSASNSLGSLGGPSTTASTSSAPRKLIKRFTSHFGAGKAGSSSSAVAATESAERARRQRAQEDTDRQLALLIQSMDAEGIDYADRLDPSIVQSWLEDSPVEPAGPGLLGEGGQFDCGICLESCPIDVVCITEGCGHMICRDCMRGHIVASLEEKKYPIPCAICAADRNNRDPSVVSQLDVELAGLSAKQFAVWTELQMAEVSIEMKCTKCKKSMHVDREDYVAMNVITCPMRKCRYTWCKRCLHKVSPGVDHACGREELEKLMASKGYQFCPGCQTPCEKISGCNHITCKAPGCKTEFCYACGKASCRGCNWKRGR